MGVGTLADLCLELLGLHGDGIGGGGGSGDFVCEDNLAHAGAGRRAKRDSADFPRLARN